MNLERSYHDECGVIAISDNIPVLDQTIEQLKNLQHRGRESAGISYFNEKQQQIETYKHLGSVENVFDDFKKNNDTIITYQSIGHTRYSTRVKSTLNEKLKETQPIFHQIPDTNVSFTIAHNGNIENLKKTFQLKSETQSDTILLTELISIKYQEYQNWKNTLIYIMNQIKGVFCLVILTNNGDIYALRDRFGYRPLCIGKRKGINSGYCITSESVALQNNTYQYRLIRDILEGEIIKIRKSDLRLEEIYTYKHTNPQFCSLEYFYFMKPSSINSNTKIEDIRFQLGFQMGIEEQNIIPESIVCAIPNTSIPAAKGFAAGSQLPYLPLITKRAKSGRTFILPTDEERYLACKRKFKFSEELKDKIIYLIDDSIVRGNTVKTLLEMINSYQVKEIHLRITAPPIISECYYGIDIPTKQELIAHQCNHNIELIRENLGVQSLKYIDINEMKKIFNKPVCTSCFTNKYDW